MIGYIGKLFRLDSVASTYCDFASYTDLCLLLYEGLKHSLYYLDNVSESELKMLQYTFFLVLLSY